MIIGQRFERVLVWAFFGLLLSLASMICAAWRISTINETQDFFNSPKQVTAHGEIIPVIIGALGTTIGELFCRNIYSW